MSTGFATYPVPPQFGQSFGLARLPLMVGKIFLEDSPKRAVNVFLLRITNKNASQASN